MLFKKTEQQLPRRVPIPETEKYWTTLYYGARGSCKTYHQAKEVLRILKYLDWLYFKRTDLKPQIVFSIQKFSKEIEEKYLDRFLYYWNNAEDLQYCPRKKCWRKPKPHRLHGAYIIFDDIATILPADNWNNTPIWLRQTFSQARHFGIRVLANLQDPMSVDINFRRYTDIAYKFTKLIGSRDPDETRPPIRFIWGIYKRRKIRAELLWRFIGMADEEITAMKEQQRKEVELTGRTTFPDVWKGSWHIIQKKYTAIYDTTQEVPIYRPAGFTHTELQCIDPSHDHTDPKAPNYCGYKKVYHELV